MDKYVVRRPRLSSSHPSRDRESSDERPVKKHKTEHNDNHCDQGSKQTPQDDLLDEEDADSSGGDGDSGLVADSYNGIPFETPIASIEAVDEIIDGALKDEDRVTKDVQPLYRSSIYVDAFNIALDTVLEQEEHLFDEKEKAVFAAWRDLEYEAQYLYVRLFLRKESAWHRTQRLSYRSNIGDLQAAIQSLQQKRDLPYHYTSPSVALFELPHERILDTEFTFAESLDGVETAVEEAVALLSLDELMTMAKQMKAIGKTKAELQSAIVHMGTKQPTLAESVLRRKSSAGTDSGTSGPATPVPELRRESTSSSSRGEQLVDKIKAITGPCIRITHSVFKLFERVHLVFYRTSEWTEKSLTTIVLAKMSKRNFPQYIVSRTANIFADREDLLAFESALLDQFKVDQIMNSNGKEEGLREILQLFRSLSTCWRGAIERAVKDEQLRRRKGPDGSDGGDYLRRFTPVHVYTRIAHYAAHCYGRLHKYADEYALLNELLDQRLLHLSRRGSWYQRKALLEERYMATATPDPAYPDEIQQKKHWWRKALRTCEEALQDRDCHLIYHYDLQKRVLKLERRLRIPRRLQHDFGHARLLAPEEHYVEGTQIKKDDGILMYHPKISSTGQPDGGVSSGSSTKTIWADELASSNGTTAECSVEEMCLNDYRKKGWKGYHSEGGIVRTLFAYLFFDILFLSVPNVFQTAYQACPLDLHTDSFYPTRASEINRRLVDIANGEAPRIVQEVHDAHFERRTCVVGLQWDFALEDVVELARCFHGDALALVCKVLAQEYRQRGGGLPDLLLWRTTPTPEVLFSEVKSANDRLSDTQRMWIHVLAGAGVRVAVCHAVAKHVRVR